MKKKPEDFTLLIVDDEEGIRKSLEGHFSLDGYRVLTAAGGVEALEIIKKEPIDFVISDIRMPEGDGVSLLKDVRRHNPDVPVIIMVTGFSEFTKEEAVSLGAMDLLSKPFDLDVIDKYIQQYVDI